jgi:hypothetical protein
MEEDMSEREKQDAKKRANARLSALRQTVAEQLSDRPLIGLVYVEELNSILHNLKESAGVNLDEFAVPGGYLRKSDGGEEGIEPPILLAKINAALDYISTL